MIGVGSTRNEEANWLFWSEEAGNRQEATVCLEQFWSEEGQFWSEEEQFTLRIPQEHMEVNFSAFDGRVSVQNYYSDEGSVNSK